MVSKTFLIVLLCLTGLIPTDLPAQDSGCTQRTVAVGVVDEQWNFVQGLSPANFRGKLHGHDVGILSASIDTSPRHIVLLLDASGSMIGHDQTWKFAKSFSEDLIRFAPSRASIAQMAFTDTILDSEGFDQDPSALLKRLAALVKVCEQPQKSRRTALYDAIARARGAPGALDFGDVIYVLTDAMDNKSETQPKRVEEDLLRAGVRLFSVVMVDFRGIPPRVAEEHSGQLNSVVETTGGNMLTLPYVAASNSIPLSHIKARTLGERIDLALQRLYEQMSTFYRLDLRLPVSVEKSTEWNLEVVHENGKPNPQLEVHYPRRLMPCGKASP